MVDEEKSGLLEVRCLFLDLLLKRGIEEVERFPRSQPEVVNRYVDQCAESRSARESEIE